MNPISSLVFVLLLTIFPTQILCQTPLIEQACGYTIYKFLCLDTLIPDPDSKNATTLKEIAIISFIYTENKAYEIYTQFRDLEHSAVNEGWRQALSDCTHYYRTVGDILSSTYSYLKYSNYTGVKAEMSEATVNRQKCDQVFQGKPFKSPLSKSTTKLSQMQNNAESIINHL
ncbi:uncharacterized protein LOC126728069 [Quercus robur]|uniref:uncharacterized protein LOC126728069 n=1 Tax=Quercus robur TaxID=38942 RepID=UPI0021614562|nr:uncharacterized protein LOC126728069 [Quercus robur]